MAGNRFTAVALTAAAAVGSAIGGAVFQAATQGDARVAISAAHDVTTRHGEIAVRVDAGGPDVTALAAVPPGTLTQVLTVGDAGIPVWRAAATGGGATFSGTGFAVVANGDAGTLAASSTSAADLRTALNAYTTVTASSFSLRDGTRGTVALSGSRLDFTLDGVAAAYYDGTARTAPRAYYAPPASAAEVALIYRLYTRSSGAAQTYTALVGLLRSGADDTAAPSASSSYFVSPAAVTLPGVARYNDGTRIYYGDYNGAGAFGAAGTGGVAWPANNVVDDTWLGVRWIAGQVFYGVVVAPSTSPPTVADLQWYTGGAAARWAGPPSLAVLALEQTGGSPSAQAITAECVLYYR